MSVENKKLSLLSEELDEESAKYITETIETWKEGVMTQLQEEVESAKQAKLEELEEANNSWRAELKEEYSEKLTLAIQELEESVKANITASILKNNPELKILEQIKELVAPLLGENYKDETYSNTIAQLAEENEKLKRNEEIMEGAEALSELLAPYSEKTQKLVLSLIKEGNAEDVTEQFYNIMESLQDVFGEEDDDKEEKEEEKKEDEKDEDEEEDEDEDEKDDEVEESWLDEGYVGLNEESSNDFSLKDVMKSYMKK